MKENMEESLREAACVGDTQNVEILLENGIFVNSQNSSNGWTPLHWAAKRGHTQIVKKLLAAGGDPNIRNFDGKTAIQVATKEGIKLLLNEDINKDNTTQNYETTSAKTSQTNNESLAVNFTPNYLSNPVFPFQTPKPPTSSVASSHHKTIEHRNVHTSNEENNLILTNSNGENGFWYQPKSIMLIQTAQTLQHCPLGLVIHPDQLVLKARIFDKSAKNQDFIEISFNRKTKITLDDLTDELYRGLSIDKKKQIIKNIRKLPDTILNKDTDVLRFTDYQEIEVILQFFII